MASSLVNVRRSAAARLQNLSFSSCSSTWGSEKRHAMINQGVLVQHWLTRLDQFKTPTGLTETDSYLVFRLTSPTNKVSIETDTPTRFVAEDIIELDAKSNNEFGLPALVVHHPEWNQHLPQFHEWLISGARYPAWDTQRQELIMNTQHKTISNVDQLESYISCFHATLMKALYWPSQQQQQQQPDEKKEIDPKFQHAVKMAWQVYTVLLHFHKFSIKSDSDSGPLEAKQLKRFEQALLERDESLDKAQTYKNLVMNLEPAQYFSALSHCLNTQPELVHKSQLVNYESFIWGMLCIDTHSIPKPSSYLRLFLEKGLVASQPLPLSRDTLFAKEAITEMDPLVELCHQKMGPELCRQLRHAALCIQMLHVLRAQPGHVTLDSFQTHVNRIRDEILNCRDPATLCLYIDPKASLTNTHLAELWLTVKSTKSSAALLMNEALNDSSYPQLNKILLRNKEMLLKQQAALQSLAMMTKSKPDEDEKSREVASLARMKQLIEKEKLLTLPMNNREQLTTFLGVIHTFASTGQLEHAAAIDYLIDCRQIISEKRMYSFLIRACPLYSPLFSYYVERSKRNIKHAQYVHKHLKFSTNWILQFLRSVRKGAALAETQSYEDVVAKQLILEQKDQQNQKELPPLFIPFVAAQQRARLFQLDQLAHLPEVECPVCFDIVKHLQTLHGEPRHAICSQCLFKVHICPFCRTYLDH